MEYYHLHCGKILKGTASIYSMDGSPHWSELIRLLEKKSIFPLRLELVYVTMVKGRTSASKDLSQVKFLWQDYPLNQFAYPFMSEKMSEIVKLHLTGEEGIDWIAAPLVSENETRQYFVPRFAKQLDVLDFEKTKISPMGTYSVPYFSTAKIANYAMFHSRFESWQITPSLVVNEPLMKALKKAKITGAGFSPAKVG